MVVRMPKSVSRLRASHFSLLVQRKVTKRKHTRAARPPLRYGCASAMGISGSSILLLRKRRTSMCAAPAGFTRPACRASRVLMARARATAEAEHIEELSTPIPDTS